MSGEDLRTPSPSSPPGVPGPAGAGGAEGAGPPGAPVGLAGQEDRLLACIHCGFCLPACPTYRVLGDEADSPRGRLHLMRAVGEGRLSATDPSFRIHMDRCLGCRACEPVCPAGVEYGLLLEHAREDIRSAGPVDRLNIGVVAVFGNRILNRFVGLAGRLLRGTGVAAFLSRLLPRHRPLFAAGKGLSMLAASSPRPLASYGRAPLSKSGLEAGGEVGRPDAVHSRGRVAVLRGCVQQELFARVGQATREVLQANGWEIVEMADAGCCGALHAHAGDLNSARDRARGQIRAFEASGADYMISDAAGCGAAMRGYAHLLEHDADWSARARAFEDRVRDVTELLAQRPIAVGAPVYLRVTYDPPCHLLHAQRISGAVEALLDAIPGVEVVPLAGAEGCCGGAGVYGLTHPELGEAIGGAKARAIADTGATAVLSGNPGCMMQIGSGLRALGSDMAVLHPVELLAESYRRRPSPRSGQDGSLQTGN